MSELDNFTRLSNDILEALSRTHLTPYEWRVLMCVFRKTYGFQKKDDWIAPKQITEMTGIHKAHVSRSLRLLAQRNMVTKRGNNIGFNKHLSQWKQLPNGVTNHAVVTPSGNKLPNGAPELPNGVSKLPNGADTKETVTKETIQKIGAKAPSASPRKGPHPAVEAIMSAMSECHGHLDGTQQSNRFAAYNLYAKARRQKPDGSEELAIQSCVALVRAAARHPFWKKVKNVETLYRKANQIAEDLRQEALNHSPIPSI